MFSFKRSKEGQKDTKAGMKPDPNSIFSLKVLKESEFLQVRTFTKSEELIENLSIMLNSGLDIATALEIIIANEKSAFNKNKLETVLKELNSGAFLWESLTGINILPQRFLNIIRIGEESGTLLDNLNIIVDQQKKEKELKTKIRSAMTYPAIVLTMAVIIGFAVSLLILPRIANVYAGFNTELPWLTQRVIGAGLFLDEYGIVFIPSLFLLMVMTFYIFFVNASTKILGERFLMSMPFIKSMIMQREMLRMGFVIGNMLQYGTPLDKALASLCEIDTYRRFNLFYEDLREAVEAGRSFAGFFERHPSKMIPRDVKEMILISERSGKLPQAFMNIGYLYEKKFNNTSQSFFVILEPALLISVWVVVAVLAFAVITPIYSLIGSI